MLLELHGGLRIDAEALLVDRLDPEVREVGLLLRLGLKLLLWLRLLL